MIMLDRKIWKIKVELIKSEKVVMFCSISTVRKGKDEIVVSGLSQIHLIYSVYVA